MVERAANGLANSRSTLITGIPAFIAFSATSVIAAPSKGSRTMASTLSLMNVSTWLICRLTSLVPSATTRSTSPSASASATADLVIDPIQPWSAAGAEKPILIFSPLGAAAEPEAAAVSPAGAAAGDVLLAAVDDELVQAVSASAPTVTAASTRAAVIPRRGCRRVPADGMFELVLAEPGRE